MAARPGNITAVELRGRLHDGGEIAIVDAREEGSFHNRHLLMASCLPLSRLELIAPALLPRRAAPIVVCDAGAPGGEGLAERAAARLIEGGWSDVSVLAGGVAAWEAAGFPVYSGVHVPSKAFAEVVEHEYGTPWISAEELAQRQSRASDSRSSTAAPMRNTTRTASPARSACPAPSWSTAFTAGAVARHLFRRQLRRAHAQHHRRPGTDRRRRAEPRRLAEGRHDGLAPRRARCGQWCDRPRARGLGRGGRRGPAARRRGRPTRYGVPTIDRATLALWQREADRRALYVLDVRDPAEYRAGHLPGSLMAPGGQLVQETDSWLGSLGPRVVLADDTGVRARMTASWLKRMGWDVAVIGRGRVSKGWRWKVACRRTRGECLSARRTRCRRRMHPAPSSTRAPRSLSTWH